MLRVLFFSAVIILACEITQSEENSAYIQQVIDTGNENYPFVVSFVYASDERFFVFNQKKNVFALPPICRYGSTRKGKDVQFHADGKRINIWLDDSFRFQCFHSIQELLARDKESEPTTIAIPRHLLMDTYGVSIQCFTKVFRRKNKTYVLSPVKKTESEDTFALGVLNRNGEYAKVIDNLFHSENSELTNFWMIDNKFHIASTDESFDRYQVWDVNTKKLLLKVKYQSRIFDSITFLPWEEGVVVRLQKPECTEVRRFNVDGEETKVFSQPFKNALEPVFFGHSISKNGEYVLLRKPENLSEFQLISVSMPRNPLNVKFPSKIRGIADSGFLSYSTDLKFFIAIKNELTIFSDDGKLEKHLKLPSDGEIEKLLNERE